MRERLARLVIVVAVAWLLVLAARFATWHNRAVSGRESSPTAVGAFATPAADHPGDRLADLGRQIFLEQGCSQCHGAAGIGNPRRPLDGRGAQLSPVEFRAWTTGTGVAAPSLSDATIRRKARYAALTEEELAALRRFLGEDR